MSKPPVGVVVPLFRHSVLVNDAIFSALDQDVTEGVHIVVVNDGCPHVESHETMSVHQIAHPDRITYLARPNGGLSAARNTGVNWLVRRYPDIEAIYLLDADNRIEKGAIRRALAAMRENKRYGWVYPDIDMFGLSWHGDYGGRYSVLQHLYNNICEAGSLVRADVFRSGIMFDENMRLGYEDWDFFLSAAEAGYIGRHLPEFGFRYRKRAESMVTDSHRDDTEIRAYLKRKHKHLFNPRARAYLEQAEAPRYALVDTDSSRVTLTTDPSLLGDSITLDEFARRYWASRTDPGQPFPTFLAAISARAAATLAEGRILHWAFWRTEELTRRQSIAALGIADSGDHQSPISVKTTTIAADANSLRDNAQLVMVHARLLQDVVNDSSSQWINSIVSGEPAPQIPTLRIELPTPIASFPNYDGWWALLRTIQAIKASPYAMAADLPRSWKTPGAIPGSNLALEPWDHSDVYAPTLPKASSNGRPSVAFALPIVDFGGVERVSCNVARALDSAGFDCHLLVTNTDEIRASPNDLTMFQSIAFLNDTEVTTWRNKPAYLGTEIPGWSEAWQNHARAAALLLQYDAVVLAHTSSLNAIASILRRNGVATYNHLHVVDLTPLGRPVGHAHLAAAYEHSFDGILTCSHKLADWLGAIGVPRDKVLAIPNAEGSTIDRDQADTIVQARQTLREDGRPLRALYMGRFDRQKGLERVVATAMMLVKRQANVELRVVGSNILEDAAAPAFADLPNVTLVPATRDARGLAKHLSWADVLLVPSHWEGLPLSIIEAQLFGVVPIATDVGAVSEAVIPGETGILLPSQGDVVTAMTTQLERLAKDRTTLRQLSATAYIHASNRDWEKAVAPFAAMLRKKLAKDPFSTSHSTIRSTIGT